MRLFRIQDVNGTLANPATVNLWRFGLWCNLGAADVLLCPAVSFRVRTAVAQKACGTRDSGDITNLFLTLKNTVNRLLTGRYHAYAFVIFGLYPNPVSLGAVLVQWCKEHP